VKYKIVWIGKTKEPAIEALTADYLKRIGRYVEVEGTVVKDEAAILKLCSAGSRPKYTLVLLDSRGKQFSSKEFSSWLRDYQDRNSSTLLFAIGPANGFSQEARHVATQVISLGQMTLAHELARVVLLEQIYRAFTIIKGHPYHLGH